MSFGNVPKDLCVSSLASLRSTASKSTNGFFSADIRTVGSLLQYQRSPGVQVTAASRTVPATQLGNMYTLASNSYSISLNQNGSVLAVGLSAANLGDSVLSVFTSTAGFYTETSIPLPGDVNIGGPPYFGTVSLNDAGDVLAFGITGDGDPAIGGDIGAVWLYVLIAGVWTLTGPKITGPGEIGQGLFGNSVSLNGAGNLLVVGCPFENGELGAAYIFNINNSLAPVFVQKLLGTVAGGQFGYFISLSADGSTLAVSAPSFSNLIIGSVKIYTNIQGGNNQQVVWTQQALFENTFNFSAFGANKISLSADGNILLVPVVTNALIFYRTPGSVGQLAWSTGALLPLPYDLVVNPAIALFFAIISQDGNTIGAFNPRNNNNEGASWIFTQGPLGTWTQNGPALIGTGGTPNSIQGFFGSLSGDGKVVALVNSASQLWVFV